MEVQLLEALRMEPGHSEISPVTGGKRRPPALAGGGIDASHWRARWRLATCNRCDLSEEETSLDMGFAKRSGGGILCRWCADDSWSALIPPGMVRRKSSAADFACDRCGSDLNRAAWRYAAKGRRICEECRTVRCPDMCDNCGRELPCEPFGAASLCGDCYEAADAGELLAMDTGGIMDDAEPVLQEPIVWETPF
jgi:hypothetical protein